MERTAFLFPGQGSQYVGMGSDLTERYAEARRIFESADAVLGLPLSEYMFGSGSDAADESPTDAARLQQTEITQPALFVHSMAVVAVLGARGISWDMAAGHSLGEYSALAASGAISFEDGLRTVRLRGELMAGAGSLRTGTMAAIIGMEDAQVDAVCTASSGPDGVVQPANYNSPGQVVISGDVIAVERAMAAATEAGARKAIPLKVSGAFHSPLMEAAREGLAVALDRLKITAPRQPVYLNVTAAPSRDPDEIRRRLLEQLTAPVRWSQIMTAMEGDGANRFVEIGAGRVLSGLAKRSLGRGVETAALGTMDDIEALAGTDDNG